MGLSYNVPETVPSRSTCSGRDDRFRSLGTTDRRRMAPTDDALQEGGCACAARRGPTAVT